MPPGDIAIVFDCGATNVRVVALDINGEIIASASEQNGTSVDPFNPSYRIWDFYTIWKKLCVAANKVLIQIDKHRIAGVTVTTFGVDGTFFSGDGRMLYPVISWQCERTKPVMELIDRYIPAERLYSISGVLPFYFNTITRLIWFKENHPEIVDKARSFLFGPSIIGYFLTGEMVNDVTMAGTSMTTALSTRDYSEEIFKSIGIPVDVMGRTAEPGSVVGSISYGASAATGIPEGTPVVATGHDTQFALFGSGGAINTPVLSSGTWEILMVRSERHQCGREQMAGGITTELDARAGLFDIGNQWIASGALEWVRHTLFREAGDDVYEMMISGAELAAPGCNGLRVRPSFTETGGAEIKGLSLATTRDEIYRATLEALAERLAEGCRALETAGGFNTREIICVGGGSRNRLWNQLRANATGAVIRATDKSETTVLGASFFVQYAAGNASSPEEAASMTEYDFNDFYPHKK